MDEQAEALQKEGKANMEKYRRRWREYDALGHQVRTARHGDGYKEEGHILVTVQGA